MDDDANEVRRKVKGAYCPPHETDLKRNPCLDHVKFLVLPLRQFIDIETDSGETKAVKRYRSFESLSEDYGAGLVTPIALKCALADAVNSLLDPIRAHFVENEKARLLHSAVQAMLATAESCVES